MEEGGSDNARSFGPSEQPTAENCHVVNQGVFGEWHVLQQMIGVHHLLVDRDEALTLCTVLQDESVTSSGEGDTRTEAIGQDKHRRFLLAVRRVSNGIFFCGHRSCQFADGKL
jgi:hypothetical protein